MKKILLCLACCFSMLLSFLHAETDPLLARGNNFYVLSIPKAGTHLLLKLLYMMTNKMYVFPGQIFPLDAFNFLDENPAFTIEEEEMENAFEYWENSGQFPMAHFNFSEYFSKFSENHPEYIKFILIRDLRDVCISCAHFHSVQIESEIGPCNFDTKLLYVINLHNKKTSYPILRIEKNARLALQWLNRPNTLICRFEDLVGEQGGGTAEAQHNLIVDIALKLNIYIPEEELSAIRENLFGVDLGPNFPSTFREGKSQAWRTTFKKAHHKAFKKNFGDIHEALGYSWE